MEWLKKRWKTLALFFGLFLAAAGGLVAKLFGREPRAPTGTKKPTKDDYKAVEEGRTNAKKDFDEWLKAQLAGANKPGADGVPGTNKEGGPPGGRA